MRATTGRAALTRTGRSVFWNCSGLPAMQALATCQDAGQAAVVGFQLEDGVPG
jgi:hypothetical protein